MTDSKIHYLYKITNLVNGKIYIGVTCNPQNRKQQHFVKVKQGTLVNQAVIKYGKNNLTFEIICIGSKDYIYDLEPKAIAFYNSNAITGHGYNLCLGGVVNNNINKGKPVQKRVDDKFIYVSGWWFPNTRTAKKKLNWGQGMISSRRKAGLLGETQIPDKKHGKQDAVYVTGFWFPFKKMAIDKLNMSLNVYEKRRLDGTLGDLIQPQRKTNSSALAVPNYFKGFWFPDLYIASVIFKMRPETIRQRILRGYSEEKGTKTNKKVVRKYLVMDKAFDSIQEASEFYSIPATTIKNKISKGYPFYGFTYEIQEL